MQKPIETADLRIVIKKCSSDKFWYCELIGYKFKIENLSTRDFYVLHNGSIKSILRRDAEFLNKKNPLI